MPAHTGTPPAVARLCTWLGAALFFVSLAYFLVSYVTTFGVPAAGSARAPAVAWNVALFTLFALHHSVLARAPMRQWVARLLPAPLERSFYVWIASVLLIAVCALWRPVPGVAWDGDGVLLWGLRLLQAAGVWLTLWSAAILDIRELAGVAARTPDGPASEVEFRASGPYGWVRHPIYTGWFLITLAEPVMTATRLTFAIVSGLYLLIAIPFEERSLLATEGPAYRAYSRAVPWKLCPWIY